MIFLSCLYSDNESQTFNPWTSLFLSALFCHNFFHYSYLSKRISTFTSLSSHLTWFNVLLNWFFIQKITIALFHFISVLWTVSFLALLPQTSTLFQLLSSHFKAQQQVRALWSMTQYNLISSISSVRINLLFLAFLALLTVWHCWMLLFFSHSSSYNGGGFFCAPFSNDSQGPFDPAEPWINCEQQVRDPQNQLYHRSKPPLLPPCTGYQDGQSMQSVSGNRYSTRNNQCQSGKRKSTMEILWLRTIQTK